MAEEIAKPNLRAKHAHQLRKTEMCKFFLGGRCGKGPSCGFAHQESEIRHKPDLKCTSMCPDFLQSGNCYNPWCNFAHNELELRTTATFFKTKSCKFASKGRCKHGRECRFAHSHSELAQNIEASGNYSASAAESTGSTSDQSNREPIQYPGQMSDLSTGASLHTRETSCESGQEELWRNDGGRRGMGVDDRGAARRSSAAEAMQRQPRKFHSTTVMMTNVPHFLTQGSLVSLLEDLTHWMRGTFDFFYCPWDHTKDRNLGYAIINFFEKTAAVEFERQWANQPLLPRNGETKRLRIVPAALQGRAANLRHFSGFPLAQHPDPHFRPLVRAGLCEVLRPMAIISPTPPQLHHMMHSQGMPGMGMLGMQNFPMLGPMPTSTLNLHNLAQHRLGAMGVHDESPVESGAETPELDNEHPLSRQVSASAADSLMAMLAGRMHKGLDPNLQGDALSLSSYWQPFNPGNQYHNTLSFTPEARRAGGQQDGADWSNYFGPIGGLGNGLDPQEKMQK